MSEGKSKNIEESVPDVSETVSKTSISKHYKPSFSPFKKANLLEKKENLTDLLQTKVKSTKIMSEKHEKISLKVEKLRKEFETEVSKINGLRNKSLYLYKLKKFAEEWNNKVVLKFFYLI